MPLGPIFGSTSDDDVTGSIAPRDGRFSRNMTDADWAKTKTAVQAAFDPANAGKAVPWDNPDTGLKGAVTPIAGEFAEADRTCKAFIATLVEGADTHWYQGHACQNAGGWTIASAAPWTPPKAP